MNLLELMIEKPNSTVVVESSGQMFEVALKTNQITGVVTFETDEKGEKLSPLAVVFSKVLERVSSMI